MLAKTRVERRDLGTWLTVGTAEYPALCRSEIINLGDATKVRGAAPIKEA